MNDILSRNRKSKNLIAFLVFLLAATAGCAAMKPAKLTTADRLKLGERMYREGILPSGKPMQALVSGDVPVTGASFTCVSCHLRSGLGAIEGPLVSPPVTGKILYQPRHYYIKGYEMVVNVREYSKQLRMRPAYTDETLAEAIEGGVDSAGRQMKKAMPRYELSDGDMAILIDYLKTLSAEFPPGVSEKEIRFATVIAGDVDPKDVAADLAPLQHYIKMKNDTAGFYKTNPRLATMVIRMLGPDLAAKHFSLAQWRLTGPPETWRAQLEEYYRKAPVYVLLGGIANGSWQPVHEFCEDLHLPCLFPSTDFPVRSTKDWYTIYFSKGIYQEGEAAARYLNHQGELGPGDRIVQVVRQTPRGKALAQGFNDTWAKLGHEAPQSISLAAGQVWSADDLRSTLTKEKPVVLLLWDDGAGTLPVLNELAADEQHPRLVFVSDTYVGQDVSRIDDSARKFTYIAYPYRIPIEDQRYDILLKPTAGGIDINGPERPLLEKSYSVGDMMSRVLMNMRGEYYRDFFIDMIDMMGDQDLPLYERLSFGPGQRYAAKGCYIVQLDQGLKPKLIKKSEWFIN